MFVQKFNTIHIKFYIKSLHKTFFRLLCNTLSLWFHYTACFGLYRPSSGVLLIVAKTVTLVAIYPVKIYLKISILKIFVIIFAPCHACFFFFLFSVAWFPCLVQPSRLSYVAMLLLLQWSAYPSQCVWMLCYVMLFNIKDTDTIWFCYYTTQLFRICYSKLQIFNCLVREAVKTWNRNGLMHLTYLKLWLVHYNPGSCFNFIPNLKKNRNFSTYVN
jgi:hypothetical protein